MKIRNKKLKGSILGFSVIMLSLILISGLTIMTVSIAEKKSGFATQKSVIAFQAADSAAERVLNRIYIYDSPTLATIPLNGMIPNDGTINELTTNLASVTGASCSSSTDTVTGTNTNTPTGSSPNYTFEITFYDDSGVKIDCADTRWRDKVVRIQSEGFYQRTARVVEIGIRPRT